MSSTVSRLGLWDLSFETYAASVLLASNHALMLDIDDGMVGDGNQTFRIH
jgi:hypothetical protein